MAGDLLKSAASLVPTRRDVTDFFTDSATFTAVIADPRFPAALAISILSGLVRGFSGFGVGARLCAADERAL